MVRCFLHLLHLLLRAKFGKDFGKVNLEVAPEQHRHARVVLGKDESSRACIDKRLKAAAKVGRVLGE